MKFARITVISVFSIISVIILWSLNKGFDFTDEGFCLLGYQNNQEIGASPSYFYIIVRKIFGVFELNIINVRIIRFLLTVFSSLVFSTGLWAWINSITKNNKNKFHFIYIFLFVTIGSFASYTLLTQSLSYNNLNAFFQLLSTGFFLYALSKFSIKNQEIFILILIIITGILLAFVVFIKLTSSIPQLLLFSFIILIYPSSIKVFKRIYLSFFLLLGFFLGLIIYFNFFQSFSDFYNGFTESKYFLSSLGYNFLSMLNNIKVSIRIIIEICIFSVFWFFIYFFIKKINKNYFHIKIIRFLIVISYFIFAFLFIYFIINPPFTEYSRIFLLPLIFLILYFLFEFTFYNRKQFTLYYDKQSNIFICLLLLLLQPFIGALGSNNGIIINSIFGITFWFAIIIILINFFNYNYKFSIGIIISTSLISLYLIIHSLVLNPYRTSCLLKQKYNIPEIKNAKYFKFDLETKNYIQQVNNILINNNFKHGDPIIGIYRMPGLIYLVGGVSPGGILWSDPLHKLYCYNLDNSNMCISNSYILLKDKYPTEFIEELNKLGIVFPDEFKKIGEVNKKNIPVKIYKPINYRE